MPQKCMDKLTKLSSKRFLCQPIEKFGFSNRRNAEKLHGNTNKSLVGNGATDYITRYIGIQHI